MENITVTPRGEQMIDINVAEKDDCKAMSVESTAIQYTGWTKSNFTAISISPEHNSYFQL